MIHIVHELRKARGLNRKIEILRQYKDYPGWQEYLTWVYDTGINYYTAAPSENTFVMITKAEELFAALNHTASGTERGNALRGVAYHYSRQFGELYRLALGGSLRAGITATTINKVYPNLIPTYPIMLAKDEPVESYPVYASTKFDGVRILANVDTFDVALRTRNGKTLMDQGLRTLMKKLPEGVYDGELVSGDGLQADRTKITGEVNKVLKGSLSRIRGATYCIFDYMSQNEWRKKRTDLPYSERYKQMLMIAETAPLGIRIVEQTLLKSVEEINDFYDYHLTRGYEGAILRYPGDDYQWRRSKHLLKKKATNEALLRCTGIHGGQGKYEGFIGALVCEGIVGDKKVKVSVGSGLSDHDRCLPPEHFAGKSIEVLYNDVVKAVGANHWSLFLPRFKRIHKALDT